jgi:phosphoenolpyruvate---glycerone phosphotransferase subunit DhaL
VNLRQAEAWLRLSAERLHNQAPLLTQLDQAIGDGDHGINMDRGFSAIVAMLDAQPGANRQTSGQAVGGLLRQAGQTLIKSVGGASGPLYGTAFLRAAAVYARVADKDPSTADMVAAMKAAAEGVGSLGRSTTGEKTMLDALVPAVSAAEAALEAEEDERAVLAAARRAADAGAQATIPMLATKGRASYLGERSIGHQDPGATSAALLLGALADALVAG